MKDFHLSMRYAYRELKAGLGDFYIFLCCIILGTAAVGGVQSLSEALLAGLHHDGRFILGGDIALRLAYQPASAAQLKFLRQNIGPINTVIETRAMARSADENESTLVEVKAVDPFYPLYGRLSFTDEQGRTLAQSTQDLILPAAHEDLKDPKAAWGIVVASEVLTRLKVHVGDKIALGHRSFVIRGVIAREPDRLGGRGFSLAPRVIISQAIFSQTGLSDTGSQVYYEHRIVAPYAHSFADIQNVAKKIQSTFPAAQWQLRTCFNAAPQMERRILQLTQFLTFMALAALLVGGIGVSNAVRSILESKRSHLAILKCLGASHQFVVQTYLIMITIMAILGVGMGVGVGALIAKTATHFVTARLALTDLGGLYPKSLGIAAAFGFGMSLCFSLWPLSLAARANPRDLFRAFSTGTLQNWPSLKSILWILILAEALGLLILHTVQDPRVAVFFMLGAGFAFIIFGVSSDILKRALRKVRSGHFPLLRLALANLTRPGNITTAIVLSVGFGVTVLTAATLTERNFTALLHEDLSAEAPSFFFLNVEPGQKAAFADLVRRWPSARSLTIAPSFRGRILSVKDMPPEKAIIDRRQSWLIDSDRGFTWSATPPHQNRILSGTWWPADYQGPPLVSISTDVAQAFGLQVGDTLTLGVYGTAVTAKIASIREVSWSSLAMNFAIIFSPGLISQAPANFLATIQVAAPEEEGMQKALIRQFPNITAVRVREVLDQAQVMVQGIGQAIRLSALVSVLAGILVLAGSMAAALRRTIYDAVLLKVLGATRQKILGLFLLEYGVLGGIAALLAAGYGTLAAWGMTTGLWRLPWHFDLPAVMIVVLASLAGMLFAGFLGTWWVLQKSSAPYLRAD